MNIIINGAAGHMGREVIRLTGEGFRGTSLAAAVDRVELSINAPRYTCLDNVPGADCLVDFSHHSATEEVIKYCTENRVPVVIATTGQTDAEIQTIKSAAQQIPVFFSANMSLGVALLVELAKTATKAMPDAEIEIIEKHHDRKLDAPSGTALMIADAVKSVRPDVFNQCSRSGQGKRDKNEIGIHAVRMGNIVGEHEVMFGTAAQTVTIKHQAYDRSVFAEGALAAAAFICNKPAGLYTMQDMID